MRGGRIPERRCATPAGAATGANDPDLFGLRATGAIDTRRWLDHNVWGQRFPLGTPAPSGEAQPTPSSRNEGEGLHQIAVGPVHAGIIEPGHFRFTANGEHLVRLEQRLGYVHKGIESLMAGASLDRAAELACRTSGDSAVAMPSPSRARSRRRLTHRRPLARPTCAP